MNAGEFIAALTGRDREARFEGGLVSVPNRTVAEVMALTLRQVLAPEAEIAYGIELDRLAYREGQWVGTLSWLLVTGENLLRVRAVITRVSDPPLFSVTHQFLPFRRLGRCEVELAVGHTVETFLSQATVTLNFEGEQPIVLSTVDGLSKESLMGLFTAIRR